MGEGEFFFTKESIQLIHKNPTIIIYGLTYKQTYKHAVNSLKQIDSDPWTILGLHKGFKE